MRKELRVSGTSMRLAVGVAFFERTAQKNIFKDGLGRRPTVGQFAIVECALRRG